MLRWTPEQLQKLLDTLRADSYRVLGPTVRDEAIVYGDISSLPIGWGDAQEAGSYRLRQRGDQSRFGYNLGPGTWKQFLYPPREAIFSVVDGEFVNQRRQPQKMAFIGVRACELAAIRVLDKVFLGDTVDPAYQARRQALLLVAVNCSQAAATCFCDSTGDGPAVGAGADLILTEVNPEDPGYFVSAGSEQGEALLQRLGGEIAAEAEAEAQVATAVANARQQMHRRLPGPGLAQSLLGALDHAHWDDVAERCLACGNCTQVCPTCFCSDSHEQVDAQTGVVTHERHWDSCFTQGHSYVAGGLVHASVRSRYRQWLTHKLGSWEQQFGSSGCTGCGRCIAWCPVGIDITEETRALIDEGSGKGADA